MKKYDPKKEWTTKIVSAQMAYPAEYVIRIFKGSYPQLNFDKQSFYKKKICDIGCGDGRNLLLLKEVGFKVYGTEITPEIVAKVKSNLKKIKIKAEVEVGFNDSLPFKNNFFDYLLSWNSCYYMGQQRDFNAYIAEYSRVLKSDGFLILSIPKKTCFIYKDSKMVEKGLVMVRNDPFGVRNGEILRRFENEAEIKEVFSNYFKNFIFASIEDDCFGLNYHWHIVVCQKKET